MRKQGVRAEHKALLRQIDALVLQDPFYSGRPMPRPLQQQGVPIGEHWVRA